MVSLEQMYATVSITGQVAITAEIRGGEEEWSARD